MVFSVRTKGLLKKDIDISTSGGNLAILERDDMYCAGKLMNYFLKNGCSVVVYGNNTGYYRFVSENEPQYVYSLECNDLEKEYCIPFTEETREKVSAVVRDCFDDYLLGRKYRYMSGKNGIRLKDPNYYKSFIQIKTPPTTKGKVITEAFLANILAPSIYYDTLHEVVLFANAPLRPVTRTFLDTLKRASENRSVGIVLMYEGKDSETEKYSMYSEDEKIFIKARNRAFEVINGEIFK